jgi:hypothetical protein
MSIDDGRDLSERLDRAFTAITPRPAPLDGAIRQGRAIRLRRRLAAATGLAVIAAAGAIVPLLVHRAPAGPAGPPRPKHTVTVSPPARPPAPGVIASGTIDGRAWRITADRSLAAGQARGTQCVRAAGSDSCGPVSPATAGSPVSFTGVGSGTVQAEYGAVARSVSYVTVQLGDGTTLALRPVPVSGFRMVGFEAPAGLRVLRATAYSARGVLATAVPFSQRGQLATFALWLRPGLRGPARVTRLVAAGTASGHRWAVTGYAGPWGYCLIARTPGGRNQFCLDAATFTGTALAGLLSGTPTVWIGYAAAGVDHVMVSYRDGTVGRVPVARVGRQKFFALAAVAGGSRAVRWRAYDGAGHQVASGRVAAG